MPFALIHQGIVIVRACLFRHNTGKCT